MNFYKVAGKSYFLLSKRRGGGSQIKHESDFSEVPIKINTFSKVVLPRLPGWKTNPNNNSSPNFPFEELLLKNTLSQPPWKWGMLLWECKISRIWNFWNFEHLRATNLITRWVIPQLGDLLWAFGPKCWLNHPTCRKCHISRITSIYLAYCTRLAV